MARAVEAITADVVFFVKFIRQAIHEGFSRHGLMESRVKDTDLRNARHDSFASVDADDVRRIVERSHSRAFSKAFMTSSVMSVEAANSSPPWTTRWPTASMASMDLMTPHSASVRMSRTSLTATLWSGMDCLISFSGHSICVSAANREGRFFDQTFCHYFFIVHVDELVLQGRAAAVYNQYDHENLPSFICLRII